MNALKPLPSRLSSQHLSAFCLLNVMQEGCCKEKRSHIVGRLKDTVKESLFNARRFEKLSNFPFGRTVMCGKAAIQGSDHHGPASFRAARVDLLCEIIIAHNVVRCNRVETLSQQDCLVLLFLTADKHSRWILRQLGR